MLIYNIWEKYIIQDVTVVKAITIGSSHRMCQAKNEINQNQAEENKMERHKGNIDRIGCYELWPA